MLVMMDKQDYDALMTEISDLRTQLDIKTQQLTDALNNLTERVNALEH